MVIKFHSGKALMMQSSREAFQWGSVTRDGHNLNHETKFVRNFVFVAVRKTKIVTGLLLRTYTNF